MNASSSNSGWDWRLMFAVILLGPGSSVVADDSTIDFVKDVQPILSRTCFACHGPDGEHREADLRLDKRTSAVDAGAIVPNKAAASELIKRVFSTDADEVMPPPDSGSKLSDSQKQILKKWINAGAEYRDHWAFVPPKQISAPAATDDWPINGIDNFVHARLKREGLTPSAEADRQTLVRRVYLDLIGLPPTAEQADAFVNDKQPNAYERMVDELLQSKHYGERWARLWLDLARYADTNGYEKDRPRSIWPYRDWVIKAINDDMPYDQFSIEQLAGDMLPNATNAQKVATGFHRNTMLNEEGGIDPLEYRFHAMVDRVATTGTVWMGLTTGCAQCHTHKYDPITHTDYYRFMALMDSADEPDLAVDDAQVQQKLAAAKLKIAKLEWDLRNAFPVSEAKTDGSDGSSQIDPHVKACDAAFDSWRSGLKLSNWTIAKPTALKTNLPTLSVLQDGSIYSNGDVTKRDVFNLTFKPPATSKPQTISAIRIEAMADPSLPAGGPGRAYYEGRKGDFFLSELSATIGGTPVKFNSSSASKANKFSPGGVFDGVGSSGWSLSGSGESSQLVVVLEKPVTFDGELTLEMLFERHYVASLGRFRISFTSDSSAQASALPVELERGLLAAGSKPLNKDLHETAMRYFLRNAPELQQARKQLDAERRRLPKLPQTLVLSERDVANKRTTHRHHRGEYLSPKEVVTAGLPGIFERRLTDPAARPNDRLTLARWLVSKNNPMVGRVTVNRAWRAFFGSGIVQTSGDFGTQSDPPSDQDLLDWMANRFIDDGWSMKRLHRLIVTSATYRQDSTVTPELNQIDPENRLHARGPRFRVDAEMVRDIMLTGSGLRSDKMFGPSVYPPQPASVTALAYGKTKWDASKGEDRYRRSLYTFTKRTAAFAAYTVFDGPSGENCTARRNRSNTPLQALTLLNDDMFVEMARAAALSVIENSDQPNQQINQLAKQFLTRPPAADEMQSLVNFYNAQVVRFESGALKPADVVGKESATAATAAMVMVARAIMNLDETITKQ